MPPQVVGGSVVCSRRRGAAPSHRHEKMRQAANAIQVKPVVGVVEVSGQQSH